MTYVLIIMIWYSPYSAAVSQHDYNTKASCEAAAAAVTRAGGSITSRTICTPK